MEKLISNVVKAQQTTELSCQHTMKLISVLFRIFTQFFILAVDLECKKGGLRSVVTHANCKMQFLCRFNILLPKDYHIGHTEMFHWIEWSKRGGGFSAVSTLCSRLRATLSCLCLLFMVGTLSLCWPRCYLQYSCVWNFL